MPTIYLHPDSYSNYEILIVDNGSSNKNTGQVIAKSTAKEPHSLRCYRLDIPLNFSKINNYTVRKAWGDYWLFLNNDTELIAPDWIDAIASE